MKELDVREILPGVESISLKGEDCQIIRLNKSSFRRFKNNFKLDLSGVYLLLSTDTTENRLYIGEGDDVRTRIKEHSSKKRFWNYIYILTSENMNIAFAKNIEHKFILKAKIASRYKITNKEEGGSKKLGQADKNYLKMLIENYLKLMDGIGLDVFVASKNTEYSYVGKNFSISLSRPDSKKKSVLLKHGSKINRGQINKELLDGIPVSSIADSDSIVIVEQDVEVDINSLHSGLFGSIPLTRFKNFNDRSIYIDLM